jgi:hypothetical protein
MAGVRQQEHKAAIFGAAFILFLVSMNLSGAASAPGPILADHNSVQAFPGLSASDISNVKGMVLLNIGQSHGTQIPHGLQTLQSQNATYGVTVYNGEITGAANGTLRVGTGLRTAGGGWQTYNGPDEFWNTTEGLNNVRRTLDYYAVQGITVDAVLHTWCWHFQSWTAGQVDAYFIAMEQLESEYPGITFIYMTDTDDSTGAAGYNRHLRNQQVRAYCQAHAKVLYDFGELETWSADGLTQATYSYNAQAIPVWHGDWQGSPQYGHISDTACTMKAKAMWWLLAEVAGASTPTPVYRFYNFRQGVHFYTTSDAEKAYLESPAGNWTFRFESNAFNANAHQVSNTVCVHRFYNFLQGVHFFTANQAEASYVNDHLWWTFRYEGVAYYAYPPDLAPPGMIPVHRFYNFIQGVHFYTANQAEATNVNDNLSHIYRYEGVAYYVPES